MSGYNKKTGIFSLTSTKYFYWLRREDIPEEVLKNGWRAVCGWTGLKVVGGGNAYLEIQATPEQVWEALSGKPSIPESAEHYYTDKPFEPKDKS